MEQTTPDQIPQAPEKEREQKPQALQPKLPAFLSQIGKDVRWYYDVRLWLPVILVLLVLAACGGSKLSTSTAQGGESIVPETQAPVQTEPVSETQTPMTHISPEAEALAILADSVGAGRSDNVKTIIMWVAINRSEDYSNGHGLTLLEEIARPNQWQGYDPEISYSQKTYDMALEVLDIRNTGRLRPLDGDMLWMVLNDDGSVTIRNQFTNNGTNLWREKTVK